MKTFKTFITEGAAHLTHIEDVILYGGIKGVKESIKSLRAVTEMMSGNAKKEYDVNLKFDGSPAVFCGIDPEDGEFFVAKKSMFNKNPKVYKSVEEVKADTKGDLADKLVAAYTEFKKLGIRDVLHGDFLFTKPDLEVKTVDDIEMVTFQANTIVYAVPVDSDIGREIMAAEVGVVWHTIYTGPSIAELQAGKTADISYLTPNPKVWQQQAHLKDLSGKILLTVPEAKNIEKLIASAETILKKIGKSTIEAIHNNPKLATSLEQFNNTRVRKGEFIKDPTKHVKLLLAWFAERHNKDIDSKKTERGKNTARGRRDEVMVFFSDKNKKNLIAVYELQKAIVTAKLAIMKHLDNASAISTLIRTDKGFQYTGHEGFVVYDHKGSNMLKLVDRLEFSHNNFSPEILKAWQ